MAQHDAPFTLTIYDDPPGTSAAAFFRWHFQPLAVAIFMPFFIIPSGEVSFIWKIALVGVCWGGVIWYAVTHGSGDGNPKPVLTADRTGFRIRGGRLRPWEAFLGAHVERHMVDNEEVQSFRIQTIGQSFDWATRVGTYSYGGADDAVQRLLEFKRKVDAERKEAAENFALGPAPVVAARQEAARRNLRPDTLLTRMKWAVLGALRR